MFSRIGADYISIPIFLYIPDKEGNARVVDDVRACGFCSCCGEGVLCGGCKPIIGEMKLVFSILLLVGVNNKLED
jgi:hypothetical protein